MRRSAAIIVNPVSGRGQTMKKARKAIRLLEKAGVKIQLLPTLYQGHGRFLAREHASKVEVIISIGGDGTLNEVINGLLDAHSDIPIAVIPAGTANVVALELKIPKDLESQIHIALEGPCRKLDLGLADHRPFIMAAGIGPDAEIVTRIAEKRDHKGISKLNYIAPTYHTIFHYPYPTMRIIVDGKMVDETATFTLVGNCSLYGGHFHPFRNADPADRLLDVCAMHMKKPGDWLTYARYGLLGRFSSCPDMTHYQGREIQVLALDPIKIQIDGDPAGQLPVTFGILPEAVSFCVAE
ncbi:MAG: diacylglycerol kinase family lipid kinase [Desulfobacteraceae bacterium]|nr:MAG: diacylglycerol kinase family lipid kinase [Desulfobacteraceae bacterium]